MGIDRSFNLWNWMDAPFNRQAFQHMREFVPTAQIARADREPSPLPRDRSAQGCLDSVSFDSRHGHLTTWATHLADSWCDAICVVHDGHIIDERYFNGMHERRLHLLMSVSKSFCGAALGVAIRQGKLVVDDLVTDLAPEFAGTSLEGATIRHVIDMTAGTDFDEDYELYDQATEQASHDRGADGAIGGEQVIPAAWVHDTRHGDDACVAAFAAQPGGADHGWSMYRNAFWVMQRDQEFSGLGIFGQYCWVHRGTRTVIARFSTYPKAVPEDVAEETMRGFTAVAEHLGAQG